MQNPLAKNSMQVRSLFSYTPDSSIAARNFFAKSSRNCRAGRIACSLRVGNQSGCHTVHRFLNETFSKDSEIYQAADLPAWFAQSATLDFSHSASANAGKNRWSAPPRHTAAPREF